MYFCAIKQLLGSAIVCLTIYQREQFNVLVEGTSEYLFSDEGK